MSNKINLELNPILKNECSKSKVKRGRTVEGIPTCLSLFSGGGGLDLGFEKAGFKILAATDHEKTAKITYEKNWPKVPFLHKDIRLLEAKEIVSALGGKRPDVIIGGPPCQGFSTLGARNSSDPRNSLVNEFIRIVAQLKPQAILIENVKAISTEYNGRYRDYVLEQFTSLGYNMNFKVLDSAEFGVAQHRQRAFFVGFADPRIEYEYPEAKYGKGLKPFKTVGDAINDLLHNTSIDNHQALNHSETVIARYKFIEEGGVLPPPEKLPVEIRRKNFGSTYKRLHRERPSLTIVPGNNALPIHPVLNRSLTVREAARIQSFPDSHVFYGDRRSQCILAGNAVPPLLGAELAKSIKRLIHPLKGNASKLTQILDAPILLKPSEIVAVNNRPKNKNKKVRGFVDLFCGAGGFLIGLKNAGLSPLVSCDFNDRVKDTHNLNFPEIPFIHGDIGLPDTQAAIIKTSGEEPFLVAGGPPCQGFSVFGKRRLTSIDEDEAAKDPRNRLVLSFVDTVTKLNPKWVIMENVAGFVSMAKGKFVTVLKEELIANGYTTIEHKVLDASDYGVPQSRKRFVLIANRTGHIIPWPKKKFFQSPKDWQNPYHTVGEFITDLADDASFDKFNNHAPMNHKPLQVERYKHIKEGEKLDIDSLPEVLKVGYRTNKIRNFSHVFKRLHRDKPSLTLVPGHNAFPIHPWLNRSLTVREAARLQTLPDDLEFVGARQDQCIQVGNAFPPLLAELIGSNLVRAETNDWFPDNISTLARKNLLDLDD
jgi:DNA (cytosine-5)-methyltransferase 1